MCFWIVFFPKEKSCITKQPAVHGRECPTAPPSASPVTLWGFLLARQTWVSHCAPQASPGRAPAVCHKGSQNRWHRDHHGASKGSGLALLALLQGHSRCQHQRGGPCRPLISSLQPPGLSHGQWELQGHPPRLARLPAPPQLLPCVTHTNDSPILCMPQRGNGGAELVSTLKVWAQ